jgi:3-oxoacyl-[acyl-carrier protein] reductase
VSKQRVALVTGAGSGIGQAIAIALGQSGFEVRLTGRRQDPLQKTARIIQDAGGQARVSVLDVMDAESVDKLVAELAASSRLEVMVVNAGTFTRAHIADTGLSDWKRQIDVNLTGAFLCLRAAIRTMRIQEVVDGSRGHIFTVNSGAGVRGFPAGVGYAASKHGLRGLVESVRPDALEYKIKLTDLVIAATVESEINFRSDVVKLPADTIAHTVMTCLQLGGQANWDRVDLGQLPYH